MQCGGGRKEGGRENTVNGEDEGDFERRSKRRRTGGRTSAEVLLRRPGERGRRAGERLYYCMRRCLPRSPASPSPSFRPAVVGLLRRGASRGAAAAAPRAQRRANARQKPCDHRAEKESEGRGKTWKVVAIVQLQPAAGPWWSVSPALHDLSGLIGTCRLRKDGRPRPCPPFSEA